MREEKCVLPFTQEAELIIDDYLDMISKKINELGFKISEERKRDFLLAVKHSLKLSSIKYAKKKKSEVVREQHVKETVSRVSPSRLIKHALQTPQIFLHVEELRRKHFQIIREKLESSSGSRIVLDAGCEYGRQLMELLRHGWKFEFLGVDIDLEALRYGKSVEPSIDFIRADIEGSLPFKDNSFDVIICIGVLNFTKKGANEAVQEFARVLKPNGLLFIIQSLTRSKLISIISYLAWKIVPKIGRLYQKTQMEKILRQNKFTHLIVDKAFFLPLTLGDVYFYTALQSKG